MKRITVKLKENNGKFFRFSGIASSESCDSYGEIIKQRGIDLSLVRLGKVIINAEHDENKIGNVEFAEIRDNQLYIEGIVYTESAKAKKFHHLLIQNNPQNPVTLSIEFVNPEYSPNNKSLLNNIILTGVALIGLESSPANPDTYAELLKSISKEGLCRELCRRANSSAAFKTQLLNLLKKYNVLVSE